VETYAAAADVDLLLTPCIPKEWPRLETCFKSASARYEIVITNPSSVSRGEVHAALDSVLLTDGVTRIQLLDDGATHHVEITLG